MRGGKCWSGGSDESVKSIESIVSIESIGSIDSNLVVLIVFSEFLRTNREVGFKVGGWVQSDPCVQRGLVWACVAVRGARGFAVWGGLVCVRGARVLVRSRA